MSGLFWRVFAVNACFPALVAVLRVVTPDDGAPRERHTRASAHEAERLGMPATSRFDTRQQDVDALVAFLEAQA